MATTVGIAEPTAWVKNGATPMRPRRCWTTATSADARKLRTMTSQPASNRVAAPAASTPRATVTNQRR